MKKANSKACPMCSGHYGKTVVHPYSSEEIIKLQATTYHKLQRLIKGLRPQQLARPPEEGKWSIKEIIAHLADAEMVYGVRYRKILSEDTPTVPAFDEKQWNSRSLQRDLRSLLEMFKAVRQNNVDLMKITPAKDWQRAGSHSEYGQLTFAQLVGHLTMHDMNHLEQIRRVRQAISK